MERRPSPETGSPGSSSPEPTAPDEAAPAAPPERARTTPDAGGAAPVAGEEVVRDDATPGGATPGGATPGGATPGGATPSGSAGRLAVAVLAYVGARLLVVAAVGGVLTLFGMPLLLSLLIAVVVALPLSLVLFRGLRARLAHEADAVTAERRERRERLRAELRGDRSSQP